MTMQAAKTTGQSRMLLTNLVTLSALIVLIISTCEAKQPHILLVVADDYGFHDIGYHGSEIRTPNLDNLAHGGVRLENYYVQPICTPTRSQLLSGRYQIHTGLQHGIIWPPQRNGLPLDSPTIADKLREAGYATHAVGKWHIGFYTKDYLPTSRGFDSYFGYLTGSEDYYTHYRCYGKMCGTDLRNNTDPADQYKGFYSTHLFANRVIDIISKHEDDKPLFIYVPFQAVHSPLQVPEIYEEQYWFINDRDRRTYAGMVSCMDEAVGNIAMAMQQRGFWDNTVMIFTTDNGGQILDGGNNYPLRGWKGSLWEGGTHGVGFIHSKLLSDKIIGSASPGLMHVTDWFPTLVKLAGGNLNGTKPLDGFDQWSAINNGDNSPRTELLHNIDPLTPPSGSPVFNGTFDTSIRAALRMGDWKIITGDPGNSSWIPPPTLSKAAITITERHPPQTDVKNLWLFNIAKDPNEYNDLSEQEPVIVKKMLDRLQYYQSTAVPCRYPDDDPLADPAKHGGFWGPWL
ncbi:arylsulfatase B-like isoform X1 [Dreissena polymorpha]|nr:arylsulfatase B-like [Dreissena polymorpha]XP_052257293.1 arylsulfatase B-like isoform X1 [Dreissena polymorpha]